MPDWRFDTLQIAQITVEASVCPRAALDTDTITDYAEAMAAGERAFLTWAIGTLSPAEQQALLQRLKAACTG
jgi:hypothetical protein